MNLKFSFGTETGVGFQVAWQDGDRVVGRGRRLGPDGKPEAVLVVCPAAAHPLPSSLARLEHEYDLKDELDGSWAVRPIALVRAQGRTVLLLEDPGGEPLVGLLGGPMETGRFLRLAVGITVALNQLHQRGLIHRDLKPAHILVNDAANEVRLTGFGIAARQSRERCASAPPEEIAGTLAYMAPEQTGRMNRPIDARSDLYSVGVTFYQMLTGELPFAADDPTDLLHSHLARRPVPPGERVPSIPPLLSAIVMKLLAKTAEERYQTVTALEADLRRGLAAWESRGSIDPFPLGELDLPDRPLIPERLYGREREIETLLAALDRVATRGISELVLVSGYAGVGKTSAVLALRGALASRNGLYASGKFDQYKRDIPYATLAHAFQALIRPLLAKSNADLAPWRAALAKAIGPNGGLLVPLIPELGLILGPQAPVPELLPRDAQHRFQMVFRLLLGVFARPAHPLVLFLDDLQWHDGATLELLEHLTTQPDVRNVLFIGAYRSNEVNADHPLLSRLSAIREAGGRIVDVVLSPLKCNDAGRLVADVLHAPPADTAPLARLVYEKTAGNPFFTIQFLTALVEGGLLVRGARWSWNLEDIRAQGFTDNVADLMLAKLRRLPAVTRDALKQLACLGNDVALAMLAMIRDGSEGELVAELRPAIRAGLLVRLGGSYRFLHDRVQEAAYALIPEDSRPAMHLAIGRRLIAGTAPSAVAERVFEIVGQINRGAALITAPDERQQVAELNFLAGQRAKASTAYASALTYLVAAAAFVQDDAWQTQPNFVFALEYHRAECEFLTGASAEADARLAELARRATELPNLAAVTRLRLELFLALGQRERAVEVGIDYLRRAGVRCSEHPKRDEVLQEYAHMWQKLGERPIEALLDLPLMTDAVTHGTMDVLTALMLPAWYTDVHLGSLIIARMANLSLQFGNSDASCLAYAWLGMILGPHYGDYKAAFRFGQVGRYLVEQRGMDRFKARVYQAFGGHVMQWTQPIRSARGLVRAAFDVASALGDLTYASFARNNLITQLIACGDPLVEVQKEADATISFARRANFNLAVDRVTPQLQLAKTLRGLTPVFGSFDDAVFHEAQFERYLLKGSASALATCWYWIRKLQARFFAGDHAAAIVAANRAEDLLWTSPSFFEQAEYHFYAALARAALCDESSGPERAGHEVALAAHHRQLLIWAASCPENFETRSTLVGAEIARLAGRESDAMRLYEQAIRSARDADFVHNQALANELAGRFYAAHGFEKIARVYLQDARHGYLRWGADGKVRQLDALYPDLRGDEGALAPTTTIGAPVEHLDLATVISVSQAVSGEIVLDKLLDTLLRTAIEQAGAERGLLILPSKDEQRVAAEATTQGDAIYVHLRDESVTDAALPTSILHHVVRTRESIIFDDASSHNPFSADPYILQHQARSILCLPLLTQAKLTGVLYLENNLAPRVFVPARTTVLKMLASQAASALEITCLYRDLAQREAKIQRLVEANIIGICIADLDGRILEANDAFLRMLGYDRNDLASTSLRWTDLTPPDWRERDVGLIQRLRNSGTLPPFEKEFYRKDGSRVPVLIGCATFHEGGNDCVSFVLDLTERKRAEEALQQAQGELAHVMRVTTLNALTASIAHEVNQPLAAIITNANAALRWIARQPPNLAEVREALGKIVQDGHRAGSVIAGMRALLKKTASGAVRVDMNTLIYDTIGLIRGEVSRHHIELRTDLAPELPAIAGDRVQLQQVLLNLMMNSIQAMKEVAERPRELLIRTSLHPSGAVLVAVQDAGVGLPPEHQEQVFETFFTTKADGLGMGLAICRLIVESHGGKMWASPNVPSGAVFQFTLPRHD
ncbi:ATP-binding sensor histidine kinase [Burkholderia ubonensis]|uniref:trifunctional serine/threonine-protein kinase/ATP-binding protein/sensor histidine kinase n=1 Tax=Burkholderia ubonensis TaxID=101571 RepID=UPI000758F2C0|nr:ATP-binding sensor histidine kinase [Burkholderia ubonensis]KWK73366.1 histidine kinase [Burkholderia ubonensis]